MAKKPDDPQQPPQDNTNPVGGSDEAIDLGAREGLPLDDMGSISVIERAQLGEGPAAPKLQPGRQVSPSDAAALGEAVPGGDASSIDLTSGPRSPGSGAGSDAVVGRGLDSGIDLGEATPIREEPPVWTMGEGSAIDLDLGPLPGGSDVSPAGPAEGSAIDLDPSALVEDDAPASRPPSAVDLGGKEASSRFAGSDSGIDLDARAVPEKPSAPRTDSGIDLVEEVIVLQEGPPSAGDSGRDFIAEQLESGVDLVNKKPASTDEPDFSAPPAPGDQSSSVDLGSMAEVPIFGESGQTPRVGSDVRLEDELMEKSGRSKNRPLTSADEIDLSEMAAPPVAPAPRKLGKKTGVAALPPESNADMAGPDVVEDEAPAPKKEKARGGRGLAVATGVGGAVFGAAACLGLVMYGPDGVRKALVPAAPSAGGPPPGLVGPGGPGGPNIPGMPPGGGPPITLADRVSMGQIDRIDPAVLTAIDGRNPADLVTRADYYWLKYLQDKRGADPAAPLSADDQPVKDALADLDAAVNAQNDDALFLRGQIYLELGKLKEAQADFEAGRKMAGDDAEKRARFDNALRALRLASASARLLPPRLAPEALALLLIGLQEPDGDKKDDKKPKPPPEAGYAFFEALELVGKKDFAAARAKLAEARKQHNTRRFLMPRRPQNPNSDPREDIFLKAADQLAAYWALLEAINDPKYLQRAAKDRHPAVDALVASAGGSGLREAAEKLAKGKDVKTADDLVRIVTAERTAAADKLKDAETKLAARAKEAGELGEKLKTEAAARAKAEGERKKADDARARAEEARTKAEADRKKAADLLATSEAREKDLKAAGDAAVAALKEVSAAAGTRFVDVKTSTAALVKDVKTAREQAATKDPKAEVGKLSRELAAARESLAAARAAAAGLWAPSETLAAWRDALPGDARNALGEKALKDVGRVEAMASATPEQKAQAQLVRGLVLRNQGKLAEAEAALKKAQAALQGDWARSATAALAALNAPPVDAVAQADELAARGKTKEALAALDRAIKLARDKKGPLYAQRANIALEAALARGRLDERDELVTSAEADARRAAAGGSARGHYLLGLLNENLGRLADAERSYRAAAAAEKDVAAGARYKIALARVVRKQAVKAGAVGRAAGAGGDARADLRTTSLLIALLLQAPGKPGDDAEVLADEVLALGDKAPFDARAQALAIKGLHTRALTTYLAGLRDNKLLAASHAQALLDLVASTPSLGRPETRTTADPLQADLHYAAGLNLFFARKYAAAEKELLSAVENDKSDARFYYFLGLARLAQGKREAQEDFDTAAELERQGKPSRAAVAAALERVQGPMRRALDDARARPAKDGK